MEWLKSKTTLVAGGCLALIGLQGYGMMSMRSTMEERVSSVERELQSMHNQDNARVAQLTSDLDVVTKRMGITSQELEESHAIAEQLKKDNAQTTQRLRRELASKADAKAVNQVREEAATKLNAVQQDTSTKIQGVSGEVQVVRTDLDTTRSDLEKSRSELGTLIAHNSTELAELRRKGERNYVEFDISKAKNTQRVGDVLVQLKKTDVKKQKYDVVINADDASILKKDRTANEPVTFMVGSDRVRYEFVVNSVDKDRIRGYLSTPKDKVLAAEKAPAAQRLQ
jgi:Skp family chaperone for outer membrane proteins